GARARAGRAWNDPVLWVEGPAGAGRGVGLACHEHRADPPRPRPRVASDPAPGPGLREPRRIPTRRRGLRPALGEEGDGVASPPFSLGGDGPGGPRRRGWLGLGPAPRRRWLPPGSPRSRARVRSA